MEKPPKDVSEMRPKHRKKLFKYIANDDRSKFKSYTKKYKIDVNACRVDAGDTLLHQVCRKGAEHILRFLLKRGVNLLTKNDRGEIPLHKACRYLLTTSDKHAYSDIVEPLTEASPESLRTPDKEGVTPRDILYVWEETQQENSRRQKQGNRLSSSDSEDSDTTGNGSNSEQWSERLKDETEAEYAADWGTYENDFYQDYNEETYRDWGDRIAHEHRDKHKRKYAYDTRSTAKKHKVNDEEEEEKRQAFQRKLEKEHNEYIERVKKAKEDRQRTTFLEQKQTYERKCETFFRKQKESISYRDVPWPYSTEKGIKGMKDLLLCDSDISDTKAIKKYLRDQQIRWHPDKFVQKCGHLLDESEKEKIMKRVNQVSQEINKIANEIL